MSILPLISNAEEITPECLKQITNGCEEGESHDINILNESVAQ